MEGLNRTKKENPIATNTNLKKIKEKIKKITAIGVATMTFSGAGEIGIKEALANPPIKSEKNIESVEGSKQEENIANQAAEKHSLGYQTHNVGETHTTGVEVGVGQTVNTGAEAQVGGGAQAGYGNYGNVYQNKLTSLSYGDRLIYENNPFNLSNENLMQVYKISHENINFISKNKIPMSSYLTLLKNHANLEQKTGFLGLGAESNEQFIARCLQKLLSTGELKIFEENLRK